MMKKYSQYDTKEGLHGKLLISSPSIADNRFYKSVILITSHSTQGTIGIVINKSSAHQFSHILKSTNKDYDAPIDIGAQQINIVLGGPMNSNNLFMIHSTDYNLKDTMKITNTVYMTNQPQIITDIAENKGPKHTIIAIGCATWVGGQLEKELTKDSWFICDSSYDLLFNTKNTDIYTILNNTLGINTTNSAFFTHNNLLS